MKYVISEIESSLYLLFSLYSLKFDQLLILLFFLIFSPVKKLILFSSNIFSGSSLSSFLSSLLIFSKELSLFFEKLQLLIISSTKYFIFFKYSKIKSSSFSSLAFFVEVSFLDVYLIEFR